MPIKSIHKQNVGDAVFEEMKQAISCGEWSPGTKIPSENELAQTMGVSRISIRSALQKLSSLGLIDSRQGEGTYVCQLDGSHYMNSMIPIVTLKKHDAIFMIEFRRMLECESAALAAKRAEPADISILKKNYRQMTRLDEFSAECSKVDIDFHFKIACATKNPMLIQVFGILKEVFHASLRDIAAIMRENNALVYHKQLIEAIEAHDEVRAKSIMTEHLESTMEIVETMK